ncbi:unnamed protein product [Prorocentrum cordatum]|uniref:Mitochondrial fission process protein 1 n=1 Tax=Prorocentrum cordatum TaxID=2364126 RepID=A0ABN9S681_9DINO|nr:unnamed protein product [Polarella glacialis]
MVKVGMNKVARLHDISDGAWRKLACAALAVGTLSSPAPPRAHRPGAAAALLLPRGAASLSPRALWRHPRAPRRPPPCASPPRLRGTRARPLGQARGSAEGARVACLAPDAGHALPRSGGEPGADWTFGVPDYGVLSSLKLISTGTYMVQSPLWAAVPRPGRKYSVAEKARAVASLASGLLAATEPLVAFVERRFLPGVLKAVGQSRRRPSCWC